MATLLFCSCLYEKKTMLNKIFLAASLLAPFFSYSQVINEFGEDTLKHRIERRVYHSNQKEMKTLFNGDYHSGAYFAINFKGHNYFGEDVMFLGAKMAGVINRSLAIGLEINSMLPSVEVDDIELKYLPEGGSMRPIIGYGGLIIEPILMSNQPVHITFPILLGAGWVGYLRDWNEELQEGEKDLLDDAVFFVVEPGVNVEFNLTRHTRLGLGVSYRSADNFELENTSKKAFNGINYNMMLKFGRF